MGVGFMGMGPGWTLPTHAIPVCHPMSQTLLLMANSSNGGMSGLSTGLILGTGDLELLAEELVDVS